MLPVDNIHQLYVEQSGNPNGTPVLVLHGGPGAGLGQEYRRFFDPERYRIIGFDQRGCGRSTPFAGLENNTTQALLEDIQRIRTHLDIDKWVLFGGSWGSTLALLSAQQQPHSVSAMILRGIFLARQQDFDWYLAATGGAAQLFPDFYQDFIQPVNQMTNTSELLQRYYQLLTSSNEIERMAAAKAWSLWEERIARLHYSGNNVSALTQQQGRYSLALMECHYIKAACFIEENQILTHMQSIQGIPATIIHGRYDAVCKLQAAYQLQQSWQNARLLIVPQAGHSSLDPGIAAALRGATDAVASFLPGVNL